MIYVVSLSSTRFIGLHNVKRNIFIKTIVGFVVNFEWLMVEEEGVRPQAELKRAVTRNVP